MAAFNKCELWVVTSCGHGSTGICDDIVYTDEGEANKVLGEKLVTQSKTTLFTHLIYKVMTLDDYLAQTRAEAVDNFCMNS